MHMSTTDVLLVIFIGVAAVSLLGQLLVLLGLARRVGAMSKAITPLLPPLELGAKALPQVVAEARGLLNETRPQIQAVVANVAEISTLARDQVRRADQLATEFAERLELQMVRVDEVLATALASVEQVTTTVRESVLQPVRDVNALVQGVRTGVDFFFRRRASPPARPAYQDEEMFI
ncbi:MAG TPA: hypothetical protein VIC54_12700 [Terriglobales bacterium]|jgi:hypothetical protein